jgi:hypothetical protein
MAPPDGEPATPGGDATAVPGRGPSRSFDPTAIDLTDVDLAHLVRSAAGRCSDVPTAALGLAREATYVTVGLTILGVQRAQVLRRQLLGD